jgi:putative NIF3 family GTP cyclohydrolase 1 type 2
MRTAISRLPRLPAGRAPARFGHWALLAAATAIGALSACAEPHALPAAPIASSEAPGAVRARDIETHLRSLGPWVDGRSTCDSFKAGDPDREVKAIAVSWMSTLDALHEARARGCDLFITHEPTFYAHMDDDPSVERDAATIEKRKLLRDSGMVVYRCHDVWDRIPRIGILDSWAAALGFEGKPVSERTFLAAYEVPATTLGALARDVAGRLRRFGQDAVAIVGRPDVPIRKVAIGTGAITSAREMRDMGADAAIVTEICWWRDVRWARDMGFPLLVVDHSSSECPGVENLARHLQEKFPRLRIEYIQEGAPFRLIGPAGPVGDAAAAR